MPKVSKTKVKQKQKQKQKQQVKVSQKVNIVVNKIIRQAGLKRPPKQQPASGFGIGQYFIERGSTSIIPVPFKSPIESKEQLEKKSAGGLTTNIESLKNIYRRTLESLLT